MALVPFGRRHGSKPAGAEAAGAEAAGAGRGRPAQLRDEVARLPFWWHSMDLGDGVITPGVKTSEHLASELEALRLPELRGRTVLDVGAWDGFYSFEAERRGAARVVALDHFVWAWDHERAREAQRDAGPRARNAAGRLPAQDEDPAAWDPARLPGKRPFDLAHRALGSRVEAVVADFVHDDLGGLGSFDVVLFLGVLYHMQDPLGALRRLARLTRATAVIETEACVFSGSGEVPLCEYLAGHRLLDDPTNWWAPNDAALRLMLLEAGFERVEVLIASPQPAGEEAAPEPVGYRTIAHAHKGAP